MTLYFITGTDTEVGKTRVACALITQRVRRGRRVAGLKPVASGALLTAQGLRNADALALQACANVVLPYAVVNPYCYEPPIAPHIAAARQGERIDSAHICRVVKQIAQECDDVVIEGAGGWRVPLDEDITYAEVMQQLGAHVVLVVGLRLGCINHALLTTWSVLDTGVRLAGWVANHVDPVYDTSAETIATLQRFIPAPLWGIVPHGASEWALPITE